MPRRPGRVARRSRRVPRPAGGVTRWAGRVARLPVTRLPVTRLPVAGLPARAAGWLRGAGRRIGPGPGYHRTGSGSGNRWSGRPAPSPVVARR